MNKLILLLILLITAVPFPLLSETQHEDSQAGSITAAALRDHVFFLASDYLNGRVPGETGYEIAARYVASQFKACGLDSIVQDEEGNRSYLSPVHVVRRRLDNPIVEILSSGNSKTSPLGESLKISIYDYSLEKGLRLPLVFAGYGISEPDAGWDDLAGIDIEGKAVVILLGAPKKNGNPALPAELNERYESPAGTLEKMKRIAAYNPAAVILTANERIARLWDRVPGEGRWPRELLKEGDSFYYHWIHADLPQFMLFGINLFLAKQEFIEALFPDTGYRPYLPDSTIRAEGYGSFELDDTWLELQYDVIDEDRASHNIVGLLPGSDPSLRDEYIVIGAHLDHLGPVNGQVRNGADDNASGSAGLIEIAEALAMDPPRRSVVFVIFTSEESGLYGSRNFVKNCPVGPDKVAAYINLDMIGRTHPELQETGGIYISGADRTCAEYWNILQKVNDRTVKLNLVLRETLEMVIRSDQLYFFQSGVPTVGFESGSHPDTHRPTDDPEKIEYDKMRTVSRLVYEFVVTLANDESRPCAAMQK